MKKLTYLLCSLVMFVACDKEEGGMIQKDKVVTIGVNQEQIADATSRVAIVENGEKFSLNWEGVEELLVANTTNTTYTNPGKGFSMQNHDGTSAVFSGTLPTVENETTTDYFFAVSSFMSRSGTNNTLRLAIADQQTANGTNVANNCILVGEAANCEIGVVPENVDLKTMCAFIKIPVTKGVAASGSTNTYENAMKLKNIIIEAKGGEQIAGRFAIDLAADDWSLAYGTDSGIQAAQKSSIVTLDCNDMVLSSDAVNLYIAVAFGEYSQGLEVTFNVTGDEDCVGVATKTIGATSGLTIARNTLVSMPSVAVSPADVSMESVETYDLITTVEALTPNAEYYMGGQSKNGLCLFTGGFGSGHGYTSNYTYDSSLGTLETTASYTATPVLLESVAGIGNAYRLKYTNNYGTYYIIATKINSGGFKGVGSDDAQASYYWTVANDTNGILLTQGGTQTDGTTAAPAATMRISTSASSNYLRTLASGNNPIQFFKKR